MYIMWDTSIRTLWDFSICWKISIIAMDQKALPLELVRARLSELEKMRTVLVNIQRSMEEIMAAQMEFQGRIDEEEACLYQLKADFFEEGAAQDDDLSFGVLLEMAIHKLNA
ncbi:hypothetical protein DVH05_015064 [Phytophthora capsici]|nr:hypothetical protein DVH05_015064 [Phytophthora capsici]